MPKSDPLPTAQQRGERKSNTEAEIGESAGGIEPDQSKAVTVRNGTQRGKTGTNWYKLVQSEEKVVQGDRKVGNHGKFWEKTATAGLVGTKGPGSEEVSLRAKIFSSLIGR